jgi:hypothetical protein
MATSEAWLDFPGKLHSACRRDGHDCHNWGVGAAHCVQAGGELAIEHRCCRECVPLQFKNGLFLDPVKHALTLSRLPPNRLEIEITEGLLLKDSAICPIDPRPVAR